MDRRKKLQSAETLLKKGNVQAAMVELEDLANSAPRDLLTLNRLGDLLAKQGRRREAIRCYEQIATQFSNGGFLPKAIAIHKKVLRLDPGYVRSLAALGELYRLQKLPGEARSYLLRAAEQYLRAREFAKAREVYERLVVAEPSDPRHRARLAEARAAEGETARAGEDLLELGDSLLESDNPSDAEKTYRRAAELLPERHEPCLGIARSLVEQGRADEALAQLDAAPGGAAGRPDLLGERVLLYDHAGRTEECLSLLGEPDAIRIPDAVWLRIFRRALERNDIDGLWERFGSVFSHWREQGGAERLAELYSRLAEVEEHGHLPALERWVALSEGRQDARGQTLALDALARAYAARSMTAEVEALLERRQALGPVEPPVEASAADEPEAEGAIAVAAAAPTDAQGATVVDEGASEPPIEAEAPAVPLNRADEEYVTGRLTQAEILEKYGLRDQAFEQVREVVDKFPGHVTAQERLVEFVRERGEPEELRDALVGLALAQRAAGDTEAARTAVEAQQACALTPRTRATLEKLGLSVEPVPEDTAAEAPAPIEESEQEPDALVTIDFDQIEDEDEQEGEVGASIALEVDPGPEEAPPLAAAAAPAPERQAEPAPPADPSLRTPGEDVLAEIRALLETGEAFEAGRRVEALRTLGYRGTELDRLEREVGAALPSVAPAADVPDDDDDLSAITAALESELFADEADELAPDPEAEQSLEDVFAAFRAHVAEEVGADDHRTHYDLGIAYKEMGLLDEAVHEFRVASEAPELSRDSFAMLGVCHREREDFEESERCYRRAIDDSNGDVATMSNLRYELAELLLQRGDRAGALDQFRNLMDADPGFRDVRARVAELEAHPV